MLAELAQLELLLIELDGEYEELVADEQLDVAAELEGLADGCVELEARQVVVVVELVSALGVSVLVVF